MSMSNNADASQSNKVITTKVESLFEKEWKKIFQSLKKNKTGSDDVINWTFRTTAPIPTKWPSDKINQMVYYAYARGLALTQLKDGEYVGPVWGKAVMSLNSKSKPQVVLITDKITQTSTRGVRPLKDEEIEILKFDPLNLLTQKRSSEGDAKIKSYYCLAIKLGNIPPEVIAAHPSFFEWLACSEK